MAGSKSIFLASSLLDHVLGGPSYAPPSGVYVAAFTALPGEAGGGTEVAGGNYARLALSNTPTQFPAAVDGRKVNGTDWEFPVADDEWGMVVGIALFDAPSGGNILYYGSLDAPRTISTGDTLVVRASSMVITED